MKKYATTYGMAELLRMTAPTVRRLAAAGKITSLKPSPQRYLFDADEVEAALKSQPVTEAATAK
jgi:excisionase family DNA binding protein